MSSPCNGLKVPLRVPEDEEKRTENVWSKCAQSYFLSFFKMYLFISGAEQQRKGRWRGEKRKERRRIIRLGWEGRKRKVFHGLVHSPNARSNQGWARSSIWVFCVAGSDWITWPSSTAFPGRLAESCLRSKASGTQIGTVVCDVNVINSGLTYCATLLILNSTL